MMMVTKDASRQVQCLDVDQHRRLRLLPAHLSAWVACFVAVVSVGILLAGCAAMKQRMGGWFGAAATTPTPEPTPTPQGASATAPRVYYAGVEGMQVRGGPSASSKVIGQLSLHERVTRFKLERGYAYVESAESATKGWVNNSQLIWRLPSAPTTTAPETEQPGAPAVEPEPEAPAPGAEEPQAPEVPEAAETPVEPTPTPTTVPAAAPPSPKPTLRGAAPSIFDAY
jgi:hypothetical protein